MCGKRYQTYQHKDMCLWGKQGNVTSRENFEFRPCLTSQHQGQPCSPSKSVGQKTDLTSLLTCLSREEVRLNSLSTESHKLWIFFDPHLTPYTWVVLCKVKLDLSTTETWWLVVKTQPVFVESDLLIAVSTILAIYSWTQFFLFKRILIQTFVHW